MATIIVFLYRLLDFYSILIVVWCIMSWIPIRSDGIVADVARALDTLVSPYMNLFRRIIPPFGGIDFSPILAIVVIQLIQRFFIRILI